jgi:hypothetical protein
MTYAESLREQIALRADELTALLSAHDDLAPRSSSAGWSANEVLLHLIGATGHIAPGVRRALTEDDPRIASEQRGGEYLGAPDAASTSELLRQLCRQLDDIAGAMRDLDDAQLSRPVSLTSETAPPIEHVPVGLWVRQAISGHLAEHVEQLRQMLRRSA